MRKFSCLIALLPLFHTGFGQNLRINFLAKGNLTFPTINDETYARPAPVDSNSAFNAYYLTPADVDRKSMARPGIELGIDLKWKPQIKWRFSTGFRVQLMRYRIEPEYKVPDAGLYKNYIDSISGTPLGAIYGSSSTNSKPAPSIVGQLSDLGINTTLFYGSLPLMLEYQINKTFFLSAGMEMSALLFARQVYNGALYTFTTPGVLSISEQQISDTDKTGFSTFQANMHTGVHYRLSDDITIDASFSGGLLNMYSNANLTGKNANFKSRLRSVALGCSYTIR